MAFRHHHRRPPSPLHLGKIRTILRIIQVTIPVMELEATTITAATAVTRTLTAIITLATSRAIISSNQMITIIITHWETPATINNMAAALRELTRCPCIIHHTAIRKFHWRPVHHNRALQVAARSFHTRRVWARSWHRSGHYRTPTLSPRSLRLTPALHRWVGI